MFCRNCGKEVNDKAFACTACGVPPLCERKFCNSCGTETQLNQVLCIKCGVSLVGGNIQQEIRTQSAYSQRDDAGILQVVGVLGIITGLGIGLWARSHSPHMGFMEMARKWDSFYLKEPAYYGILAIAVLFGLAGIISIAKSFMPASVNNNVPDTHLEACPKCKKQYHFLDRLTQPTMCAKCWTLEKPLK